MEVIGHLQAVAVLLHGKQNLDPIFRIQHGGQKGISGSVI
jgi:hypothetical protein